MADVLAFPAGTSTVDWEAGPAAALSDAEARRLALDTESSCIVEAPAGSGKTGLLMQRFLKLLSSERVSAPEEILAITFTRKATAELRERVLEQLAAAAAGPLHGDASGFERDTRAFAEAALERDRELGWGLLERPHRLGIQTIDAVAASIAHSLPLLSGSGGSPDTSDETKPLYREAARRTLMQLGGRDGGLHSAVRTVLLHRDGNLGDCEALLARMLAARDQWGELIPLGAAALDDAALDREVRPRLERSLENIVCAALTRATQVMPPGFLAELTALGALLALEPGHKGSASPIALCADRHETPEAVAEHLEHWVALTSLVLTGEKKWRSHKGLAVTSLKFKLPTTLKPRLVALIDGTETDALREALCAIRCLPPPRFPDEQWHVARALFRLLRHALAELKVLFAERGQCDFVEVGLSARDALRSEAGAADPGSPTGSRLQHLLVDEMQDTSSSQYELIDLLTRSWDGHSQTLFLVGDPKQSIYLFRKARVERFLRTMDTGCLGEIRLRPLRLSANFRAQAELVKQLNGIFPLLFPSAAGRALPLAAGEVPFTPAVATRPAAMADLSWHLGTAPPRSAAAQPPPVSPALVRRREEACEVRRVVERWQREPLPGGRTEPWRMAVLVRNRSHLSEIVAEFKSSADGAPIPFRAVDIDSLAERPEVLDALALTRALLHPGDRIAWLAVLHAPWCGLELADLLTLAGEGTEGDRAATVAGLVATRRHLLRPEAAARLDRCWPVLQTAALNARRGSLAVQVERTWRSLGGDAPLSAESRSNVRRFLGLVREVEAESPHFDLSALVTRVAQLFSEPASGTTAVELMTIHKAKGLEWDVVLVPGLERPPRRTEADLLNWIELDGDGTESAHILLAPIWGKGEESDRLNGWIRRAKAARATAECKRLFYVACTRAREELHLFATARLKKDGGFCKPVASSLLAACWAAAEPRFDRLAEAPASVEDEAAAADLNRSLHMALNDVDLRPLPGPAAFPASTPPAQLFSDDRGQGLSLAAAADPLDSSAVDPAARAPATLRRLPLSFDPLARFDPPAAERLRYPAAAELPRAARFERPEGSFAVRAFGNVVHRYLQLLCQRRAGGVSAEELLAALPSWEPRVLASLRGEGLPPGLSAREASRALGALRRTLGDPVGRWILAPHPGGSTELELSSSEGSLLRADRTFSAGSAPGAEDDRCVWIVDFKTTDQGARSDSHFAEQELSRYRKQLEAYAAIFRSATGDARPVHLGLFYPLSGRFLQWEATHAPA